MKLLFNGVRLDHPHLVCQNMSCQNRSESVKLPFYVVGVDLPSGQQNMSCQNRNQNLWNFHCYWVGVDLPHLICQIWAVRIGIKICEIAVLHGVDLPLLVGQIWAVRIGINICEIAILWHEGRSATPDLPNMSCQNRNQNLWNCHSMAWG